jgi:lipopolysaccharide/colanic/teichoic acid biosynthesis glycosyltransferase
MKVAAKDTLREEGVRDGAYQQDASRSDLFQGFITDNEEEYVARLAKKAVAMQAYPANEMPAGFPAALDGIVAALLIGLTAPLMLIIALLVRLDSPGPALFRQVRIGQNRRRPASNHLDLDQHHNGLEPCAQERREQDSLGRLFVFYKFRTMRHDGRELYPHLYNFEQKEGTLSDLHLAMPNDPRVTRLGHFLRRTSLDELPNLFNILKGDMAFVGPRPELPDVAKYYKQWQKLKFKVKPGLTGKAQVSGRGFLSFEETIIYDVEYVLERSFWTDLRLLWKTVFVLVRGIGAF